MNNKDEFRITFTSIILATGLAVLAFTDFTLFYKILFGIPALVAFLYLLAMASSLRFFDNGSDHLFPIPIFLFSSQARRNLYNLAIDVYIIALISMLIARLLENIPFLSNGIGGLIIFVIFNILTIAIPNYKERLGKKAVDDDLSAKKD